MFFDFVLPHALNFDQKLTWNNSQIILEYHTAKQFLPCLNWLVICFWFQNKFWKNISCFRFWWKTYRNCCTSNYVKLCFKTFFPYFLQLVRYFQFQVMIWKMEKCHVSKNTELRKEHGSKNPNFDFVPLLFTLLTLSYLCCSYKLF